MNATRDLSKLSRACGARILRLQLVVSSHSVAVDTIIDRRVAFAVIEAHNLWSSFIRAFYLSCALNTKDLSGKKITATNVKFQSRDDALLYAVRVLKKRTFKGQVTGRDEPAWHLPANVITLFQAAGMTNMSSVQAALSYPTLYFKLLPLARHFYAHRNADTRKKVEIVARSLGLSAGLRPTEIMCTYLPLRPQNILTDWLWDMQSVIQLMCR